MNEVKVYLTSDVAKIFGIGRNTLRLYEEIGLLTGLKRTRSGYRQYTEDHIQRLSFILEAKKSGFTLNEIKSLLSTGSSEKKITCGSVSREISEKIEEIETAIKNLNQKKRFLGNFLNTCASKSSNQNCEVLKIGFNQSACC